MNLRTKRIEVLDGVDCNEFGDRGCFRCGKHVKPGRGRWIHVIYGGGTILHPDDEAAYLIENDAGDCGCYVLGSDCARKLGLEWSVPEAPGIDA